MMAKIKRIRQESPNTRIVVMGVRETYPPPAQTNVVAYSNYLKRIAEYKTAFNAIGNEARRHGGVYIPDMFAGLKREDGLLRDDMRRKPEDPCIPIRRAVSRSPFASSGSCCAEP